MSGTKHYRPQWPIREGYQGRVACGRMGHHANSTLVRNRVTCGGCKRSVAFTMAQGTWHVSGHGKNQVPMNEPIEKWRGQ